MSTRIWWTVIAILGIVIAALLVLLIAIPAPSLRPDAASTATSTKALPQAATSSRPLHERVVIDSPRRGATVEPTFTVTGKVPGSWSFEAQFPVFVVDPGGNKIGLSSARLTGDWMTAELVPFTAAIETSGYRGPATLVLLKDNPSGLPENDDSLEIPIVIQ